MRVNPILWFFLDPQVFCRGLDFDWLLRSTIRAIMRSAGPAPECLLSLILLSIGVCDGALGRWADHHATYTGVRC